MAFADLTTYSKSEILDYVQAMLTRPEMYSQNPASLEDQVLLLLGMIWSEPGGEIPAGHITSSFEQKYDEYRKMVHPEWPRAATSASVIGNDYKAMTGFLKGFVVALSVT